MSLIWSSPGFSAIDSYTNGPSTIDYNLWEHVVGSGETGSYPFTPATTTRALDWEICEYSGVNIASPIDQHGYAADATGSVTQLTSPSLTPSQANDLPVLAEASLAYPTPSSYTQPTGYVADTSNGEWGNTIAHGPGTSTSAIAVTPTWAAAAGTYTVVGLALLAPAVASSPGPTPTPITTPTPIPTATPVPVPTVNAGIPAQTGINPWWDYEEDAIPGVGRYIVNIAYQNLIVQADDMAIPNKGVELAFRRTYNAQSQHDYAGSDGSQISNYGNGWTNTFDAHIAFNSGNANGPGISVFDIDGARYDYLSDGQGHWLPPAGVHAQLTWDGACGYNWTKKSGSVYAFWTPDVTQASCAPTMGPNYVAYDGRMYTLYGRNHNTYVRLTYAWDNGNAGAGGKLNQILAQTEAGQTATLAFADFNGERLLASLTWPDGTITPYAYDGNGNLTEVDLPKNSTSTTVCQRVSNCN
ncbi:MAG: DUF6531 domain-containing protein, partial [Vulcanimicrobiaceae bacterium]